MSATPGDRELDELVHRAEAALRRQESEIAEVLAGVERARSLTERARVEIEQERAQDAADRRAEEDEARRGQHGHDRQVLQRRLDAEQTTWRAVLSGADEHESAVAYREAVGVQARAVVERLREEDPEWGSAFDRFGPDSPVEFPDPPVDDRIDPLRPGALGPSGDTSPPRGPGNASDGPRRPPGGGGVW
jgi:hypothetical protein